MYVHTHVRFNSSETTGRTTIKFGAIDHHLGVSVIARFVTSSRRVIVFQFTFLNRGRPLFAQTKDNSRFTTLQQTLSF